MTVASTTSKSGPYAGNGVTTVFAVGFTCFAAADLSVVRTDAGGVDTVLTIGTDYTVSLNADQTASPGGTVTAIVAPATGYQLTILRNVALTQGTSLPNQGGWYPKVVENAFDKLTMIVQQLSEKVGRSVQVGVTGTDTTSLLTAIFGAGASATAAAASAAAAAASAASVVGAAPAKGADIASAATINLTTSTGDFVHVTGTTTITGITLALGAQRTVIFDAALTLTHGAALLLPGLANISTAAGDRMIVRGDSGGVVVIEYQRANGLAVVNAMVLLATITPTVAAAANALTAFTSTYDTYLIVGQGLLPGVADDSLEFRLAVAGAVDSGSNYFDMGSYLTGATSAAVNKLPLGNQVGRTGRGLNFELRIQNANAVAGIKTSAAQAIYENTVANNFESFSNIGAYKAANAVTGVSFFWLGGNNFQATGKIRIYGMQNV